MMNFFAKNVPQRKFACHSTVEESCATQYVSYIALGFNSTNCFSKLTPRPMSEFQKQDKVYQTKPLRESVEKIPLHQLPTLKP